jgi:hypothetical protein
MNENRHTVCFCDNGPAGQEYAKTFCTVATEEGLVPEFYLGTGTVTRTSNQDHALRDSFYAAEVVVVRLAGSKPLDNWAVPELRGPVERCPAVQSGKKYLIYADALGDADLAEIKAQLVGPIRWISGISDFSQQLKTDLRAALGT